MANTTERLNITIPKDVMADLRQYCDAHDMGYSAFMTEACRQLLNARRLMPEVHSILGSMSTVFERVLSGQLVGSDAQKQMDDIDAKCAELKDTMGLK